jgi:hypothetical protein
VRVINSLAFNGFTRKKAFSGGCEVKFEMGMVSVVLREDRYTEQIQSSNPFESTRKNSPFDSALYRQTLLAAFLGIRL